MVYLKKKGKKRPTVDQIRHQATKALTKACKLTKSQIIMKLVRKRKVNQGDNCNDDKLPQKLEGLKSFSHVSCGERLTKVVFGEFVPPLEDEVERQVEETISKNKRIIECKTEWINKLKDVHNLMERQSKAAQAKRASDLRKQGLTQDAYGGLHEIGRGKKTFSDANGKPSKNGGRGKRLREEVNEICHESDEGKGKEERRVETIRHGSELKAPVVNRKQRRQIESSASLKLSTGGRTKTFILGPSVGTVDGTIDASEGEKSSDKAKRVDHKNAKVTTPIHPSWAAKQKQKAKLSTTIDLNASSKRKKIKFDDTD